MERRRTRSERKRLLPNRRLSIIAQADVAEACSSPRRARYGLGRRARRLEHWIGETPIFVGDWRRIGAEREFGHRAAALPRRARRRPGLRGGERRREHRWPRQASVGRGERRREHRWPQQAPLGRRKRCRQRRRLRRQERQIDLTEALCRRAGRFRGKRRGWDGQSRQRGWSWEPRRDRARKVSSRSGRKPCRRNLGKARGENGRKVRFRFDFR